MYEVGGGFVADHGQAAQVYQGRAVAVEHDDRPVGSGQCDAQADRTGVGTVRADGPEIARVG
jgi:hypothetical protein